MRKSYVHTSTIRTSHTLTCKYRGGEWQTHTHKHVGNPHTTHTSARPHTRTPHAHTYTQLKNSSRGILKYTSVIGNQFVNEEIDSCSKVIDQFCNKNICTVAQRATKGTKLSGETLRSMSPGQILGHKRIPGTKVE